ncbi:MAG: hypothetical protein NZO16_05465 [Deltaproteobacteria bacterium]|nr:hypothetical protein [Deltaproteobacteria bacterium]
MRELVCARLWLENRNRIQQSLADAIYAFKHRPLPGGANTNHLHSFDLGVFLATLMLVFPDQFENFVLRTSESAKDELNNFDLIRRMIEEQTNNLNLRQASFDQVQISINEQEPFALMKRIFDERLLYRVQILCSNRSDVERACSHLQFLASHISEHYYLTKRAMPSSRTVRLVPSDDWLT